MSTIATIDFHITCKCNQDCPYCWGPQDIEPEVDRRTAAAIIRKISETGAKRIVFTGGDPLAWIPILTTRFPSNELDERQPTLGQEGLGLGGE